MDMWEAILRIIFFILTIAYVFSTVLWEPKYTLILFLLMVYFGVKSLTYYNWKGKK